MGGEVFAGSFHSVGRGGTGSGWGKLPLSGVGVRNGGPNFRFGALTVLRFALETDLPFSLDKSVLKAMSLLGAVSSVDDSGVRTGAKGWRGGGGGRRG